MISGKKCRHLNRAGVDIAGKEAKAGLTDPTIDQFLRHNPIYYHQFTVLAAG
jgi:hypothetical protein